MMRNGMLALAFFLSCACAATGQTISGATSDYDFFGILADGRVAGWAYDTPFHIVLDGNDYVTVSASRYNKMALHADGTLTVWQHMNWNDTPPVPTSGKFKAISSGYGHGLAIREDGSIAAWGWNANGQVDAPTGNDYVAVAASYDWSAALKSDGTLVDWGHDWGPPPEGNDFVALVAGMEHCLALRRDGSIAGWGHDWNGEAVAPAGTGWLAVAGGQHFSVALASNGALYGWPAGFYLKTDVVPAEANFVEISCGLTVGMALRPDGTMVAWGDKTYWADPPAGTRFLIPEPGTLSLMVLGGMALSRRRRHRL